MRRREFIFKAGLSATVISSGRNLIAENNQEILPKYDVLVCGGGTAGTIATIQSARIGAKTLLVESGSQLGGTMTTGGVNFPGLFHAWGKQVISGIGWELVKKTVELHGDSFPDFSNYKIAHWKNQVKVNEYLYACFAEDEVLNVGAEIFYYTFPQKVSRFENGYVVELARRNKPIKVFAKQLVDCTGDATLSALAGFERVGDKEAQPGTLIYHISNYDVSKLDLSSIQKNFKNAIEEGTLKDCDMLGRVSNVLKQGGFNTQHTLNASSETSEKYTNTNISSRKSFLRIFKFLKSQKGLENLKVDYIKTETGIRETYRIVGETIITVDDYLSAKRFSDAVSYSFYPIDLHTRKGVSPKMLKEGNVPTVPLSALIPKGAKNLIVAGRCVSSDRLANSALRVQASCMAMGQVAGAAAALSSKESTTPADLDIKKLKDVLIANNAIVP